MKRLLALAALYAAFALEASAATIALEHGWRFTRGDDPAYAAVDCDDSSWRQVSVPHDWGVEGGFAQALPGETGKLEWWGTAWYRLHLRVPVRIKGSGKIQARGIIEPHYRLDFSGVMSGASVYVNGILAGGRPYGYSSWSVPLDGLLRDGDNVIAVRVDNKPASSRWYPGGGIYRNVYLRVLAAADVAYNGVAISCFPAEDGAAKVSVAATICNHGAPARLEIKTVIALDAPEGALAKDRTAEHSVLLEGAADGAVARSEFVIPGARLWSPDNPEMYAAVTTVRNLDTGETSVTVTPFGIRSAGFTPEGFFLNGEKTFLKGVCLHHDAGALGAVWNRAVWQRRLSQLKEMGCNAIRCSHNPPAPEFLDLCDEMGFMVIDELTDTWTIAKTENGYATLFDEWAERDLVDMIRRDRNHPCVILWSIGNECGEQGYKDKWDIPQRLTDICHREDPTRATTAGNDNLWASQQDYRHTIDVYGFNYKPHAYEEFHRSNPDKPYYGSETASCISSRGYYMFPVSDDKGQGWLPGAPYQVSSYDLYAPYWASSPDYEWLYEDQNPSCAGEFVWTGFDYLGEPTPYNFDPSVLTNFHDEASRAAAEKELEELSRNAPPSRSSYFGIFDLAGFPKDRYWLYRSRWREDVPTAHILPHWNWPGREGEVTPVHVYTSGDSAELFVNGVSQGVRTRKKGEYRLRWDDVRYYPGQVRVVCWRNGLLWACDSVSTASEPVAIRLSAERIGNIAFITAAVVDEAGVVVPTANNQIAFSVTGPGGLLATDAGDATSHVPFSSRQLPCFAGLCSAIVECPHIRGRHHKPARQQEIIVTATSEGLQQAFTIVPDERLD